MRILGRPDGWKARSSGKGDPATPAICKDVILKALREEQFVNGGIKGVAEQGKMEGVLRWDR